MKKFLPVLLILLIATVAFAQNRSRIVGTVTTADGAVIEGVKVTISSKALIAGEMSTMTNDRGQFRFVLLPIGVYTVKLEKAGYSAIEQSGVEVDFDATVTIDKVLTPSDFEDVITITGEAPVVDKTSSSASDKLDIEFLQNTPNTRNIWGMPNLSAGFTDDSAFGGVADAGQAYNTDGVNVSDPATGTVFSSINFGAVEQVDVQMFGANAEYGAFTGASINVVTKSGGNELSGEFTYFAQRVDWVSDNTEDFERIGAPTATDSNLYEFSLGGPIVQDKIWFFANYLHQNDTTQRFTLDGTIDQEETPRRPYGKISARWDDRNITYASWIHYERDRSHRVAYGGWSNNHEDGLWQQVSESDTYLFQHSYVVNDDIILEGRFAGFRGGFDLVPRVEGETLYNYDTREYGHSLSRTDLYTRNRDNLLITSNYYNDDLGGQHSFKFGFEYESSLTKRFYSHHLRRYIRGGDYWRWYDFGEYEGGTIITRYAGFAQDSWSVNDKLTLNLGLRWDDSGLSAEEDTGGLANGTDEFMDLSDIAPRIGFAYDLMGDGKTVLKGFVGRYYEGVVSGDTEAMVTYVPPTSRYSWNGQQWVFDYSYGGSAPGAMEIDPDISNQYTQGFMIGIERELAQNIAGAVSFIYKEDDNIIGNITPNTTWDIVNVNGQYFSGQIYDNQVTQNPYVYGNPEKGDNGVLDELKREFWAVAFELNKRMSDNWSLKANYTFTRNTGNVGNGSYGVIQGFSNYSDPNSYINGDGRLWGDIPHTFKATGTYIAPFDIFISPSLTWRSGRPYGVYEELGNDEYAILIKPIEGEDRYDNQMNLDFRVEKAFIIQDRYRLGLIFDMFNVFNDDAVTSFVTNVITDDLFGVPDAIVPARFYQVGVRLIF